MSPTDPIRRKRIPEDSSDSNRKEKKDREERKRKKDHKDDVSRKRHKARHKGKDHHHNHHHYTNKSSDKQKTRKKVSRRKRYRSSDTSTASGSSSSSSTSTDGNRHRRHRRSRLKSQTQDRLKDDSEKRVESTNGNLGDDCHGQPEDDKQSHWLFEAPLKLAKNALERHPPKSESSSPLQTSNGEENRCKLGTSRTAEACIEGKESSLEISLRQKALANFMKHQVKMDAIREKVVSATCLDSEGKTNTDTNNGIIHKSQAAMCIEGNLASNNTVTMNVLEGKLSTASDVVFPVQRTTTEKIPVVDGNLEEGEISRDATKLRDCNNASTQKDEISYKRVEETGQGVSRDDHKLIVSGNVQEKPNLLSFSKDVLLRCESTDLSNEHGLKSEQVPGKMKDVKGLQVSVQEEPVETMALEKVGNVLTEMKEKPSSLCNSEMQNGGQENGSGFQQKTMSVMRGGDLVQVNYKVYIPKRAVELARRRSLKR